MLLAECERGGGEIVLNARGIEVEGAGGGYRVASSQDEFAAEALVVATGGLSIPKLGATGLGYELARQFGLAVVEPRPALVPLTLGGDEAGWSALAGVAAEVVAATGGTKFREKMLVTHRGLSGPAILQASSYWRPGEVLLPVSIEATRMPPAFVTRNAPRTADTSTLRPFSTLTRATEPGAAAMCSDLASTSNSPADSISPKPCSRTRRCW